MARIIRSALLTLAFVTIVWSISSYWNWNIEMEERQKHFVEVCLNLIEATLERTVTESLVETPPPELSGYVEIAKKLGGYLGFDTKLGKVVIATRTGTTVKSTALTLNLNFSNFVYYVCDPSNVVLASSENSMVGKQLEIILSNLQANDFFTIKYEGRPHLFGYKNNERYGFRIFAGIPYKNVEMQNYIITALVVAFLLFSLLSSRRSVFSEEHLAQIVQDIVDKRKFDEKSVKDKRLREQLFRLVNKLERSERLLQETVEKLEKLKQLLETKKERS